MCKTVAELHAENLPHATCEAIGLGWKPKDGCENAEQIGAEVIAELDQYLRSFTVGPNCPGCDSPLGGIFGTFEWGVATGEGNCCRCGYPARGQHATKSVSGLNIVLPYHPDVLVAYRGSPEYEAEKAQAAEAAEEAKA